MNTRLRGLRAVTRNEHDSRIQVRSCLAQGLSNSLG